MTRVIRVIFHNWPLKLAAIGLATLLYGGLVFSQSTQTFEGVIPVDVINQPKDTFLLDVVEPVTTVRYFAPSGVRPIASTFEAWIDLEGIEPGSGPKSVRVNVRSIDNRITVISSAPDRMTVDLDKLDRRIVPVKVPQVPAPEGTELGPTTVSPTEVEISGPASVLVERRRGPGQCAHPVRDRCRPGCELVPVDANGDAVGQVNVEPATARVTIPVFSNKESRTLTISPLVAGDPAPGFELIAATARTTGRHGRGRHRRPRATPEHRHRPSVDRRDVGRPDARDDPRPADGRRRPRRRVGPCLDQARSR